MLRKFIEVCHWLIFGNENQAITNAKWSAKSILVVAAAIVVAMVIVLMLWLGWPQWRNQTVLPEKQQKTKHRKSALKLGPEHFSGGCLQKTPNAAIFSYWSEYNCLVFVFKFPASSRQLNACYPCDFLEWLGETNAGPHCAESRFELTLDAYCREADIDVEYLFRDANSKDYKITQARIIKSGWKKTQIQFNGSDLKNINAFGLRVVNSGKSPQITIEIRRLYLQRIR